MNCIFCNIIAGNAPCRNVYEDDHCLVIMDTANDVDGHMLAIPKKHVTSILDCDDKTLAQVMSAVKAVSQHCVDHCGYDGVNVLNASEEAAGQSVPHLHFHIIPRKQGDRLNTWPPLPGATLPIEEVYKKLIKDCES